MSDINELRHAIRLAEKLAEGVLREDDHLPTIDLVQIRKDLAAATIHAEMASLKVGVDLIEDHAELDDRLRRVMTAIAKEKGVEVERDPYADLDETEIEFADGQIVQLKAKEYDLRILATKLREGERDERVGDELYEDLMRAQLMLTLAKLEDRKPIKPESLKLGDVTVIARVVDGKIRLEAKRPVRKI